MADNTTDTNHDGKVDASEAHSAADRARAAIAAKNAAKPTNVTTGDIPATNTTKTLDNAVPLSSASSQPSQPTTQPQEGDVNADGQTYQNGKWIYLGSSGLTDQSNASIATPLGSTDAAPAVNTDQSAGKPDASQDPNMDANTGREVNFNPPVAEPQVIGTSPASNEILRYTTPVSDRAVVHPADVSVNEERDKPQDIKDHEAAHPLPEEFQVRRTNVVSGEHKRVYMTRDEFNNLKPETENGQEIRYELVQF